MTASLWAAMVSRMILMLLLLIIGRILVPLKIKANYFISSLLYLLVADNPAKIIASWIEFFFSLLS